MMAEQSRLTAARDPVRGGDWDACLAALWHQATQGHALHLAGVRPKPSRSSSSADFYKTHDLLGMDLAWRNLGWILGAPFQYLARRRGMLASPTVERAVVNGLK